MKNKILVIALIAVFAMGTLVLSSFKTTVSSPLKPICYGEYCEGWKDGFVEGYCYGISYGCIKPLVPLCPIPRMGESNDNYQQGYNRGFLAGKNQQESEGYKY